MKRADKVSRRARVALTGLDSHRRALHAAVLTGKVDRFPLTSLRREASDALRQSYPFVQELLGRRVRAAIRASDRAELIALIVEMDFFKVGFSAMDHLIETHAHRAKGGQLAARRRVPTMVQTGFMRALEDHERDIGVKIGPQHPPSVRKIAAAAIGTDERHLRRLLKKRARDEGTRTLA